MGEAKRRKAAKTPAVIYHHTSTLCTNLLWMSGVIQIEGKQEKPLHPQLGFADEDPRFRRAMADFPPVAWFTTEIAIPGCLTTMKLMLRSLDRGEVVGEVHPEDWGMNGRAAADAYSLDRLALGFHVKDIPAVPWPDYPGYHTPEGRELNETAREYGDNPNRWYISEQAVDLACLASVWTPRKGQGHRLERNDRYLADVRRMVAMCKARKDVFIPPSWLTEEQARALAKKLGVPAQGADEF